MGNSARRRLPHLEHFHHVEEDVTNVVVGVPERGGSGWVGGKKGQARGPRRPWILRPWPGNVPDGQALLKEVEQALVRLVDLRRVEEDVIYNVLWNVPLLAALRDARPERLQRRRRWRCRVSSPVRDCSGQRGWQNNLTSQTIFKLAT